MKFRYSILFCFLLGLVLAGTSGCKKFLSVDPVHQMSGNNFWKTRDDVEKFTTGMYVYLRAFTCKDGYTMLGIGDLRGTAWVRSNVTEANRPRSYIPLFNQNNIKQLFSSGEWWRPVFGIDNLSDWGNMYSVVAITNTIIHNMDNNKDITGLEAGERKQYRAEAVFVRSLVYYLMARHWGDVPYVTDINDRENHERMNQVELFKNCLTDLETSLADMPWYYPDFAFRGVRAGKGSALALMMEMNMWMAAFDIPNEMKYWTETVRLGDLLTAERGKSFDLLPIENYKEIFRGNSRESLFEIGQDYNYGETFGQLVSIANIALRTPYKNNVLNTYILYHPQYLHQLYDADNNGARDMRIEQWFESPLYMYQTNGQFLFKKFINTYSTGQDESPNDNRILWRFADVYLLKAEALERLKKYAEAVDVINVIRNRAGAEPFVGTETNQFGQTLEDAIWWEREREKMGEGTTWYDLVRTRKILSSKYTPFPITYEDYLAGAWTYPIHNSVMSVNPLIKPNTFWLQ